MIVSKRNPALAGKIVIDTSTPAGSAMSLMSLLCTTLEMEGVGVFDITGVMAQMTMGDFEHLLSVFEKFMGDRVVVLHVREEEPEESFPEEVEDEEEEESEFGDDWI